MASRLLVPEVSGVMPARDLLDRPDPAAGDGWSLDALAGRFVELLGSAALTLTASLILEAQRRGELPVWVGGSESIFFPPDFAAWGIDLDALSVIRVETAKDALRAADMVLRSGGFAVAVLDAGEDNRFPLNVQTRLSGLAKRYRTTLVCINATRKDGTPPSSLVSLRGAVECTRSGFDCFTCTLRVIKDKRRNPGWGYKEVHRGPDGLC